MPFTKYFCKNGYTQRIGMVETTMVAARIFSPETFIAWFTSPKLPEESCKLVACVTRSNMYCCRGFKFASVMYITPAK